MQDSKTSKLCFSFTINDKPVQVEVDPNQSALHVIREILGLTGTKEGCGIGECGACTILADGIALNSCLMLAGALEGRSVITVEGLKTNDNHRVLQKMFEEKAAVQCGFCSPGMLLSAVALLSSHKDPTDKQIVEALSGNLCRCTGYKQIFDAVKSSIAVLHSVERAE